MIHAHKLKQSFKYALRGVWVVFRDEQNFRVQLVIAVLVVTAAFLLSLPIWKITVLLLISVFVLVLELANSIFERLIDTFQPRLHHAVGEMKDIMAAAVLLAAIGSVIIGAILFWPHLALFFRS